MVSLTISNNQFLNYPAAHLRNEKNKKVKEGKEIFLYQNLVCRHSKLMYLGTSALAATNPAIGDRYGKWEVLRYVPCAYCSGKKILSFKFYVGATISVLVSLEFG